MNEKTKEIFDLICRLTLNESKELKQEMVEKFDITENTSLPNKPAEIVEEEVEKIYTIKMKTMGSSKVDTIKTLKSLFNITLTDAMKIINELPYIIKIKPKKKKKILFQIFKNATLNWK